MTKQEENEKPTHTDIYKRSVTGKASRDFVNASVQIVITESKSKNGTYNNPKIAIWNSRHSEFIQKDGVKGTVTTCLLTVDSLIILNRAIVEALSYMVKNEPGE